MSVAVFSSDELESMWGCLDGKSVEVGSALYVLGCANRCAYMTSYREDVAPPRMEAPRFGFTPAWAENVRAWVDNLLYNCVSNGGNDFAPESAKAVVLDACQRTSDATP